MKLTEIRALKDEDLKVRADNLRRELFDARFKGAVEQIAHPARLRELRRDVARIMTVLRERVGEKAKVMTEASQEQGAEKRNARRAVIGKVTSAAMQKTIVVQVDRLVKHPIFKKYVRKSSVFKAHDPDGVAKKGDRVEIVECRPISKTKRFRLVRVVQKSKGAAPEFAQET